MSCHPFPIGHGSFWTCCVTTTALKKTVSKDLSFLRLCIFECSRIEFCFTPFKALRSQSRWSKVFPSNGEGRFEISFIFFACANLLRLLRLRNLTRMLKLGWPVGLLLKMSSAQSVTGLLILVNWVVCGTAMEPLSLYRPPVSALYSSSFQSSDSCIHICCLR